MYRYSIILLIAATLLFFSSCKKESPILKVIDEATFSCEQLSSDFFFEGFINGEKVCFHVGFDDYEMYLRQATGTTAGATFNPYDPGSSNNGATWGIFSIEPAAERNENSPWIGQLPLAVQYFQIETPKFQIGTELKEIIHETLNEGDLDLIEEVSRQKSFNIKFVIVSKDNKNLHAPLQSFGGNQEGSYLRVTELEIEESGNKLNYTVTFEFECNLYIAGSEDDKYGRLEDGIFRMAFSIDK